MNLPIPKKCSVCGKPVVEKYRPFCSARCADVDLGRWMGEKYKLPTDEPPQAGDIIPDEEDT